MVTKQFDEETEAEIECVQVFLRRRIEYGRVRRLLVTISEVIHGARYLPYKSYINSSLMNSVNPIISERALRLRETLPDKEFRSAVNLEHSYPLKDAYNALLAKIKRDGSVPTREDIIKCLDYRLVTVVGKNEVGEPDEHKALDEVRNLPGADVSNVAEIYRRAGVVIVHAEDSMAKFKQPAMEEYKLIVLRTNPQMNLEEFISKVKVDSRFCGEEKAYRLPMYYRNARRKLGVEQ